MPDVTVKVKTLDSNTHSFTISDSLSVQQFKASIESSVGVNGNHQRLIYCGKVLVDDKLLSEYDLNGKTVHLVQRAPPSHAGPSTSTASSADDSGNFSTGSRSTPSLSSTARLENNQLVGAWYLPSAFDPAGIQSMVQGVISNLGDLGRNATVLSNEDGSAVDVRINLTHLANPPASMASNANQSTSVWPSTVQSEANPSIIQHHHFTPSVPVRVMNNPFASGFSDPLGSSTQQLQVNLRVNLIKSRLTIIQSELQEIQRLSQQTASVDPPTPTTGESDGSAIPSASDEAPMETSTPSASGNPPTYVDSSSVGLDVAARAASAAASAAETAAILARQAAASLEALIYADPRTSRSRQQGTTVHSSGALTVPPLTIGVLPISIDIESAPQPSTSSEANPRPSSSSTSQSSNDFTSQGSDGRSGESQRRITAGKFADILRSVRQAESNYHEELVKFEDSLRSPFNASHSSRNAQIQSLIHRIRHQLILINNTLSELCIDFNRPELTVMVQAAPVATVSPPTNGRSPRSSSSSRSPNTDRRGQSVAEARSSASNSNATPSQARMTHGAARITIPAAPTSLILGASSTPITLYGGPHDYGLTLPAPSLTHRLVFAQNRPGQERSTSSSSRSASSTSSHSTPQQAQQGQQQQQQRQQQHTCPSNTATASGRSATVSLLPTPSPAINATLSSVAQAAQAALESTLNPATISTSNWQSAVSPAWVPVITNDLTRQQSESNSSKTTFSDAYLNGLPKKKRRTDEDGSSGGN